MPDDRKELSDYRLKQADDSLKVASLCVNDGFYKDSINRSYYSAFYAVKAVLALDKVDFKRHKDVIAHFNQYYVATDIFQRDIGKQLASLQKLRERVDYNDFYIASKEIALSQIDVAELIFDSVKNYLSKS